MKHFLTATFAAMAISSTTLAQDETPQIMVLGTFHFTGGGADYINPEVDDYLAATRQAEIEALVDALAQFNPTKIVVELLPEAEEGFNADYQRYLAGDHQLTVNERQQIGMRLAARLGHDRLFAADYRSGMDFDAMMAAGGEYDQGHLMARLGALQTTMAAWEREVNRPDVSVSTRLRTVNTPEMLSLHNVYLTLAQLGSADNPVGAQNMANWWGRNLHIFAQIGQLSEPGDRILVIYGSGHKFLFDQFFQDAVEFDWVDVLDYIPAE
ncbi:DUF5694 domain-containing protein [Hyphobacterium sp.]|uniref:DUF5694 domain-containing protein n=1 Tax=Hyphobacterium sp. TaxID=2004662 RepID=UPI003BABDF6D